MPKTSHCMALSPGLASMLPKASCVALNVPLLSTDEATQFEKAA